MKKGNLGVGLISGNEGEEFSARQMDGFEKFLQGHMGKNKDGEDECKITLVHGGEEGADEKAHWISTDYYCDKIIIPSNEDREEYWTGKACCSQTTILDIESDKKKRMGMIIARARVLLVVESEDAKKNTEMLTRVKGLNKKNKPIVELPR